jgi:broad specificity phosphatase PhoE
MALRLTLIAHGATAATRRAAFPCDEPLEERALRRADLLGRRIAPSDRVLTSPAQAARQTAEALGLAAEADDELCDCDYGRWAGERLDALAAAEPAAVAAWLSDPDFAGHGGESVAQLIARVAAWLERQAAGSARRLIAVTHASVIRAAVVNVLAAPASAFWRIDVAPLGSAEIAAADGRWTLHALTPDPRRFAIEPGAPSPSGDGIE